MMHPTHRETDAKQSPAALRAVMFCEIPSFSANC
jgi:hypothetical protein